MMVFLVAIMSASQVSVQLPPEILADRHLIEAEQLHSEKDYIEAFRTMQKIVALQKEHDFKLPDEFHFKYAKVALSTDSLKIAIQAVNKYLMATGKAGGFYKEALALSLKAERLERSYRLEAARLDRLASLKCAGQTEGTPCWMEVTGKPGCYIWTESASMGWTVSWTGECSGTRAHGVGRVTWAHAQADSQRIVGSWTGRLEKGVAQGQWVYRDSKGRVKLKGAFVNGERQGTWSEGRWEGPYVDHKKHGQWVERDSKGRVKLKGAFVNGERQGTWSEGRWEGPYVDHKKHGQWVERDTLGTVFSRGDYSDGMRQGRWVIANGVGTIFSDGEYVDGQRHGRWNIRGPRGVLGGGQYVDGKEDGDWTELWQVSKIWGCCHIDKGRYENGKRQGQWVQAWPPGFIIIKREGSYVNGKKHGKWVTHNSDGTLRTSHYMNGVEVSTDTPPDGARQALTDGKNPTLQGGSFTDASNTWDASSQSSHGNQKHKCEIPGYYQANFGDTSKLGLPWCPRRAGFQTRTFALQIAGMWCTIYSGELSTSQIETRKAQIRYVCDQLDALARHNGVQDICGCDLSAGIRP